MMESTEPLQIGTLTDHSILPVEVQLARQDLDQVLPQPSKRLLGSDVPILVEFPFQPLISFREMYCFVTDRRKLSG